MRYAVLHALLLLLPCHLPMLPAAEPVASSEPRETVADRLWIWGHPAGVYNDSFLRPVKLVSTIEPVEAARRMGLANMIFVRYDGKPAAPFNDYYVPFQKLDRVLWSLVAAGGGTSQVERDAAFSLAERNRNIVGFILDDFFHEPAAGNAAEPLPDAPAAADAADRPFRASLSPEELRTLRRRQVRGVSLPLMAVIYTRQVKPGARPHIAEVDQLCLWTWRPADLEHLADNFAALEQLAPDKQLFLGCYMYDFHESKPLPVALMRQQVELGHQWLKEGRIAGMIFLATPNVDVGLEAVEWTRRWIRANGSERLPSR
jgi:hypothetical protein